MRGTCFCLLFLVALAPGLSAGAPAQAPPSPRTSQTQAAPKPSASAEDVRSVDSILAALYAAISGPAGQPRDWDRFRSLFLPGARLLAVRHLAKGGAASQAFTVEEYAGRAASVLSRTGFYEREIARRIETYSHLSQVFSSYESRHAPGGAPFERGINAIQLIQDGHRWWVASIVWEAETKEHPLPEESLKP